MRATCGEDLDIVNYVELEHVNVPPGQSAKAHGSGRSMIPYCGSVCDFYADSHMQAKTELSTWCESVPSLPPNWPGALGVSLGRLLAFGRQLLSV